MKNASNVLVGIVFSLIAAGVQAQAGTTHRNTCHHVGPVLPEPVGEGRALQISRISCRVENGPLAGAVLTGMQTYEFQGPSGKMIHGEGVVRMAGSLVVYQNLEGATALTVTDGKVTGATSAGKGIYKAGYGAAGAPMAGKTYSYSTRITGPGTFVLDVIND